MLLAKSHGMMPTKSHGHQPKINIELDVNKIGYESVNCGESPSSVIAANLLI
jgi:hypothetical protein